MVELQARTAGEGLLPVTKGAVTLTEVTEGQITSVMPFEGRRRALSDMLVAAHGVDFPDPNVVSRAEAALCQWTGRGQAFLIGPAPDARLSEHAAITDQSDAWVRVHLSGDGVEDVLARLVPLDLRPSAFPVEACARSLLQHMSVCLRRDADGIEIMSFRSMAATLVHEIADAMAAVAARAAAG